MDLNNLDIGNHEPDEHAGQDWFMANDIDLTCPVCKGTSVKKIKPEATIVAVTPKNQREADKLDLHGYKDVTPGVTYYKIVPCLRRLGDKSFDDGYVYATEDDAQEALDDEDNWEEEDCDECDNGYLSIIWNTIFNTGFHSIGDDNSTKSFGNVVAFEYNGTIWFGLMGCGMDMSPYIDAWFHFFPNVSWIPDNWINLTNLFGGYYSSCCGKELEDKVFKVLKAQLKSEIAQKKYSLGRINERLKDRTKGQQKVDKSGRRSTRKPV